MTPVLFFPRDVSPLPIHCITFERFCLGVTPDGMVMTFFAYFHPAIFQCDVLLCFLLVLRKSLGEESPVLLCHWPWRPWTGGLPAILSIPFGMTSISPITSVEFGIYSPK